MIRQVILRNYSKFVSQKRWSSIICSSNRHFSVQQSDELTHFGYETVKTSEKAEKGKKMVILFRASN